MGLNDLSVSERIEHVVDDAVIAQPSVLEQLAKPMKETLSIELLLEEQGHKKMPKEDLYRKMDAIDVEESIEEILETI